MSIKQAKSEYFAYFCIFACLLLTLLKVTPVLAQQPEVYVLKTSEWNIPRTTDSILTMPALKKTVRAFSSQPGSRIQILYPGGDEGTLWASELRSWLVSLGIASRYIELLPGSSSPDQLELQVIPPARGGGVAISPGR